MMKVYEKVEGCKSVLYDSTHWNCIFVSTKGWNTNRKKTKWKFNSVKHCRRGRSFKDREKWKEGDWWDGRISGFLDGDEENWSLAWLEIEIISGLARAYIYLNEVKGPSFFLPFLSLIFFSVLATLLIQIRGKDDSRATHKVDQSHLKQKTSKERALLLNNGRSSFRLQSSAQRVLSKAFTTFSLLFQIL